MSTWKPYAKNLAASIVADDALHDVRWRAAIENTPRHHFVPYYYEQNPDGSWRTIADTDDGYLEKVYRNTPLTTALAQVEGGGSVTVSSSSKPGLMTRMLEAADIANGRNVCEIGTGTGYNAALMCHVLGDEHVASIDIGTELVRAARARLHALGYQPAVLNGDGAAGMPEEAPFDRIIATCSVPRVPAAWAQQLDEGGLLLVDLKPSVHAGNLVLLRREGDRLSGRFLAKWAGFMTIRTEDSAPESATPMPDPDTDGVTGTTTLDPYPWNSLIPWFLAHADHPGRIEFGVRGVSDTGPQWTSFTAEDGSWAQVRTTTDDRGRRETLRGGPTDLWKIFEDAHAHWQKLGKPGWEDFGLTVTENGTHTVWLQHEDKPVWTLT